MARRKQGCNRSSGRSPGQEHEFKSTSGQELQLPWMRLPAELFRSAPQNHQREGEATVSDFALLLIAPCMWEASGKAPRMVLPGHQCTFLVTQETSGMDARAPSLHRYLQGILLQLSSSQRHQTPQSWGKRGSFKGLQVCQI